MAFKYAIALTGSIATGKSTVSEYFRSAGFVVIDADHIAHTLLDAHKKELSELFGNKIIVDNKINRQVLGKIVFNDIQKRKTLEAFIHPLIFNEIEKQSSLEDKKKKPYFIDIPLFFETNRYPIKKILVVYTTKELQLKRLINRDKTVEKEALKRINTQIDIEEKRKNATYVVNNIGDKIYLQQECDRIKKVILGDYE